MITEKNNILIEESATEKNLFEIFAQLIEDHEEVFPVEVDGEQFICKPLGRKDWIDVMSNDALNNLAKEEIICNSAVLYPKNYDFSNCAAGIPSTLAEYIVAKSHFGANELNERIRLMSQYRKEMYHLDHQMTCIICEAFPSFTIEEVENWSLEKSIKYMTRAEWILQNLHGLNFESDPLESLAEMQAKTQTSEIIDDEDDIDTIDEGSETDDDTNLRGGKKEALTPEKLAELKSKFPEIKF